MLQCLNIFFIYLSFFIFLSHILSTCIFNIVSLYLSLSIPPSLFTQPPSLYLSISILFTSLYLYSLYFLPSIPSTLFSLPLYPSIPILSTSSIPLTVPLTYPQLFVLHLTCTHHSIHPSVLPSPYSPFLQPSFTLPSYPSPFRNPFCCSPPSLCLPSPPLPPPTCQRSGIICLPVSFS